MTQFSSHSVSAARFLFWCQPQTFLHQNLLPQVDVYTVWSGALALNSMLLPPFYFFCLTTLKSQYSNHTCITLGIIVSCSGIGETDATLKMVSAQVLYLPTGHRTINTAVSCSK